MRLATFDADRSVIPLGRRSITAAVKQLPTAPVQYVSTTRCVRRNDQLVDRFDTSR